ncbi:MAG: hypothetical protein JOZ85_17675 [Betaproteobacteria bacterium]|nr:hypothetical protein [Betaproteobacteria bacterium]
MKRVMLLAAAALAAHAWAQQPAPAAPATPAAPAAAPTPETPKAEMAKADPAKKAAHKPNPHRQEDARHCLDKATNTEIIKCAEAYL